MVPTLTHLISAFGRLDIKHKHDSNDINEYVSKKMIPMLKEYTRNIQPTLDAIVGIHIEMPQSHNLSLRDDLSTSDFVVITSRIDHAPMHIDAIHTKILVVYNAVNCTINHVTADIVLCVNCANITMSNMFCGILYITGPLDISTLHADCVIKALRTKLSRKLSRDKEINITMVTDIVLSAAIVELIDSVVPTMKVA